MTVFIQTDRLLLREIVPGDEAGLFALDADPEVHRYLGNRPVTTMDEVRASIAFIRQQYADHGIGRWAVEDRATGAFLGWAGLKWMTQPANGRVHFYDLGYRLLRAHWGKGIATEAALASVDYAFRELKAPALYGMADCGNRGSHNVLTKAGLHFVEVFDYQGVPHHWYALERAEWEAAAPAGNRL
ncbi:MAG: N-acetyltransferase [Chitinophagaceae bacterium]|nr:MAG: N-acetyltransferase [Chitinophagaceae bacterium]